MTDKKRAPRELAPGKAIEKLKYLADDLSDADGAALEAHRKELVASFAERLAKKREAILSRVHEAARDAVAKAAESTPPADPIPDRLREPLSAERLAVAGRRS